MKKFLKVFFVMMMAVSLVACGSADNTPEQKKVVNQFFKDFKNSKLADMKDYMTSEGYKEVEDLQATVDTNYKEMLDEDTYGEVTVKEAKKFLKHVFAMFFKDMKITSVKESDKTATVTVKGKGLVIENVDEVAISDDLQNILAEYENSEEMKSKLMEVYLSDGQEGMMKYLMNEVSPALFKKYTEVIDKCDYDAFTTKFKLIEKDGEWIISSMK